MSCACPTVFSADSNTQRPMQYSVMAMPLHLLKKKRKTHTVYQLWQTSRMVIDLITLLNVRWTY